MKNKLKKIDWVIVLIGIIFLSAAIFRIFNYSIAQEEIANLNLPAVFTPFLIVFEILLGICFLGAIKIRLVSLSTIIFLVLAVIIALISNFDNIIATLPELMTFRANANVVFLHVIYIVLLVLIYLKYKNK